MSEILPGQMVREVMVLLVAMTGLSLALAAFFAGMVVGLMVRVD